MDNRILPRMSPFSRAQAVRRVREEGQELSDVAAAFGMSPKTIGKWLKRFDEQGLAGLQDRSSRPRRIANKTSPETESRILSLRREKRFSAPHIARELGLARSTVSAVLARNGIGKLRALDPKPDPRRYEHDAPGDLLHLDVKKLGRIERPGHRVHGDRTTRSRGAGWEYVHVCIDDHSRVAYVEVLPDERQESAVDFLKRAMEYFAKQGIITKRILTDNGGCYRSHHFNKACQAAQVKHSYTKPYTPRTNGKAERFIQTMLKEWAYNQVYDHSLARQAALGPWLKYYNTERIHGTIGTAPANRLQRAG